MVPMYVKNVFVGAGPIPSAIILAPLSKKPAQEGSARVDVHDGGHATALASEADATPMPVAGIPSTTSSRSDSPDSDTDDRNTETSARQARKVQDEATSPYDELPINVGLIEATSIGMGIDGIHRPRPMTHDLLGNVIGVLGGTLESVSITRVEGTTFYATLDIASADGTVHRVDARPSDAVALAVREDVPILASEELLAQAGSPNFDAIAQDENERKAKEFHDFVEGLSPDDFKAHNQQ